ncbi:MAG: amidohydrolase [Chloroflexi bacterium]|nr:amidohydrolase [Chloroflexota bacterium]
MPDARPTIDPHAAGAAVAGEQRISADSHMAEPPDLFETRLPKELRERALHFPKNRYYETNHHLRAGGWDPHERLRDLALDGVSAEVLFPTYAKQAWLLGDPALEEAHIRVYNDWLIEFCAVAPERFWGLAMLSMWDAARGAAELERCVKAGLRGADIWIGPPDELPFSSPHYEPLWTAAESLGVPVNLHINTGPNALRGNRSGRGSKLLPEQVSKLDCMSAVGHIIGSGVLERHPGLNIVIAEAGLGWVPFFAQEYDYYFFSRNAGGRSSIPRPPSDYIFERKQVWATFISDRVGGHLLEHYGQDTFMWSNDYPHPACTWPTSSAIIEQDLGHLSVEARLGVTCVNAARLYNGGKLPPAADEPGEHQSLERWNVDHVAPAAALAEALSGT